MVHDPLLPEDGIVDVMAIKAALNGWRNVKLSPFEARVVDLLKPTDCRTPAGHDVAL